jgi:hypothetical protein
MTGMALSYLNNSSFGFSQKQNVVRIGMIAVGLRGQTHLAEMLKRARIVHLEYQAANNWQKVHDFMIKYQDRLLYATDGGIEANADINQNDILARKISDWQFFTSNDTTASPDLDQSFKGLKLPKQVIDKIYRINAEKWYPGISLFKKKIAA